MNQSLFNFNCSACNHAIEAEKRLAGTDMTCPDCRKRITIPQDGVGISRVKPGLVLGGYRLEEILGRGGMGEVYRATQLNMERDVAVKILAPALTRDSEYVHRFLNEVRLLAKLDHPNIVTAIDAGQDSGIWYLAMSYVDGAPLSPRLEGQKPLPEREAVGIVLKVALALQYAWEKHRLLHRDIKPSNILIDRDGEVKLTDLGVSKTHAEQNSKGLTMTGMVVGTPHYMSPEQARGEPNVDFRSDMYALGATYFHLATGSVPFDGSSPMAIISRVLVDPLPSPRDVNPGLSQGSTQVIRIMMARDASDRYQNWEDLIADLRNLLRSRPPTHAIDLARRQAARENLVIGANGSADKAGNGRSSSEGVKLMVAMLLLLAMAAGTLLFLVMNTAKPVEQPSPPPDTSLVAVVPAAVTTVPPGTASAVPPASVAVAPSSSPGTSTVAVPSGTKAPLPGVAASGAGVTTPGTGSGAGSVAVDPGAGAVFVGPPAPTEAEVRQRALEEMYNFAMAYLNDNPTAYEAALEKFRQLEKDSAGTKFIYLARDQVTRLETLRGEAIAQVRTELDQAATPLARAGRFDEAVTVYQNYAGQWAAATRKYRDLKVAALRDEQHALQAEIAAQQKTAQDKFAALAADIAGDFLRLDLDRPTARIMEARRDLAYTPLRDQLDSLSTSVYNISKLNDRQLKSLYDDIDKDVVLDFKRTDARKNQVKLVLKIVTAQEIRGLEEVKVGDTTGRISRTFKLADLSLMERMNRLGEGDPKDISVMKAILAIQAKRLDLVPDLLLGNDRPLSQAILASLSQRLEEKGEVAAERDFPDVLRTVGLLGRATDPPETLASALKEADLSRCDVTDVHRVASEYLKRYADTAYGKARLDVLNALAALDLHQWPTNNLDGLFFAWDDERKLQRIPDPRSVGATPTASTMRVDVQNVGDARIGDDGALSFNGGAIYAFDFDGPAMTACRRTNELTISAWVKAARRDQRGPARLITLSKDQMSRDFMLGQTDRDLVLRIRTPKTGDNGTSPELRLCEMPDGPFHVVVTYKADTTICYINGVKVLESRDIQGDFSNWDAHRLVFGNERSLDLPWYGSLRAVALYARALSADEVAQQYDLVSRRLKPPPVPVPAPVTVPAPTPLP